MHLRQPRKGDCRCLRGGDVVIIQEATNLASKKKSPFAGQKIDVSFIDEAKRFRETAPEDEELTIESYAAVLRDAAIGRGVGSIVEKTLKGDFSSKTDMMMSLTRQIRELQSAEGMDAEINIHDLLVQYQQQLMDDKVAELIKAMEDSFEEIRSHSADTGLTVYFEVSPLQYGLWTAGKGTFMDELASICGLRNAFSDVEGWAQISEEQVLQRNPDLIVTISMAEGEQNLEEEIAGRSGWEHVKAVEEGHIYAADNDEFSRPGPRLMDAAKTLSDIVQGIREESHES